MGAVADATLAAGGEVLGVIPEFLTRMEVAHTGVTSASKSRTACTPANAACSTLADAFITLPGGLGTLDETVEIDHLAPAAPARQTHPDLQHQQLGGAALLGAFDLAGQRTASPPKAPAISTRFCRMCRRCWRG